jgi:hypothetical protein
MPVPAAVVLGGAAAMSSTAIALKLLAEQDELTPVAPPPMPCTPLYASEAGAFV